jgi:prepilin-type N-terminal cleavage/methylation domain-containing protein
MKTHTPIRLLRDERGFTLIELLVSMIIGLVVCLAAFSILQFTTEDVSLTSERAHVTQTGRTGLEKIMLELHSTCVDGEGNYHPIKAGSNGSELKFISETSPVNSESEPTSSLSTVHLRKIVFKSETLIEKSWLSKGNAPKYEFNESETPTEITLLKGVKETEVGGIKLPIFQYYRYYESGDAIPTGHSSIPYGELYPTAVSVPLTEKEAERAAKVRVAFTLDTEGKESIFAKGYRPVNLEDSAIFSLEPSSENASDPNFPCNET